MPDLFLDAEQQTALAFRVNTGDRAAEEELVKHFAGRVFALLLARTRDREAARDLLQETMLATISALRAGRLNDPAKLAAFIQGTARNQASGYIRDLAQRRERDTRPQDCGPVVANAEMSETTERDSLTREALLHLESTDRTILMRTLVDGEKPGAIATLLGMSSEVVRQRKTRAIRKVAEYVRRASQTGSPNHQSGRKHT